MQKRELLVLCILAVFFLISLALFFPTNISILLEKYGPDSCQPSKNYFLENYKEVYECYLEKVSLITYNEGVDEGIRYMRDVVSPRTNFGLSHLLMHEVGHEAWHSTESLDKARSFAPTADTLEEYWRVDGFIHGVFHGYFEHTFNETSIEEMILGCSEYDSEIYENSKLTPIEKLIALDCYHAMGHGIMTRNENALNESIANCDLIEGEDARGMCYYGAFMENAYLYLPFYFPGAPRPDVEGDSMVAVCKRYEGKKQEWCALFVAWSPTLNDKPIEESFELCEGFDLLDSRRSCISLPSKHILPRDKKGDFEIILDTCLSLDEKLNEACIVSASAGLRQGVAGYTVDYTEFCELVPKQFKARCLNPHRFIEN